MELDANWEPLFRSLEQEAVYEMVGRRRYRRLVDWSAVVSAWRQTLADRVIVVGGLVAPMFETRIEQLPAGASYPMAWDIQRANELALARDLRQRPLSVLSLAPGIRTGSVRTPFAGPILVAEYLPLDPPWIILDGNHRVAEALGKGLPEVAGLVLPEELMLAALMGSFFVQFYRWHMAVSSWLHAEVHEDGMPDVDIPPEWRHR